MNADVYNFDAVSFVMPNYEIVLFLLRSCDLLFWLRFRARPYEAAHITLTLLSPHIGLEGGGSSRGKQFCF